jgi:hypothetical protein
VRGTGELRAIARTQGLRYYLTVPTIIREDGYEIRIYTLDDPPPHVHVAKAGAF